MLKNRIFFMNVICNYLYLCKTIFKNQIFRKKFNTEAYFHPNASFRSPSFSNIYNFNIKFLTYLNTCDVIYLVERYLNEVQ